MDPKSAKAESEEDFLAQAGVSALLRGALLKLVEARPEDPIGFLSEHFTNEASETEGSGGADGGDSDGEGKCHDALEEQQLNKALWHLSSAHHSQRCRLSPTRVSTSITLGTLCPKRKVLGPLHYPDHHRVDSKTPDSNFTADPRRSHTFATTALQHCAIFINELVTKYINISIYFFNMLLMIYF